MYLGGVTRPNKYALGGVVTDKNYTISQNRIFGLDKVADVIWCFCTVRIRARLWMSGWKATDNGCLVVNFPSLDYLCLACVANSKAKTFRTTPQQYQPSDLESRSLGCFPYYLIPLEVCFGSVRFGPEFRLEYHRESRLDPPTWVEEEKVLFCKYLGLHVKTKNVTIDSFWRTQWYLVDDGDIHKSSRGE